MLVGETVIEPKLGPSESIFVLLITVSTFGCWGNWLVKPLVSQKVNPPNEYEPGVFSEGLKTVVAVNSPFCNVPLESSHPPRLALLLGLPPEKPVLLAEIIPASIPVTSLAWTVTATVTGPDVMSILVGETVIEPKLGPSKSADEAALTITVLFIKTGFAAELAISYRIV